jgi:septum formation protein
VTGGVRVVLASASPRRAAILRMLGIEPEVPGAVGVERAYAPPEHPADYAKSQALAKLRSAGEPGSGCLVLAADTIVVLAQQILGKPRGLEEAREMLALLSGRTHEVITAVALATPTSSAVGFERTEVTFRRLAEREIAGYVQSGEPLDKAGAYGIQDRGASLVRRIEGCFFNVMGLPVSRLLDLLEEVGLRYDPRVGVVERG